MPQSHRTGLHIFSLQRQDSTVAAKNFVTLVNPAGSDKFLTLGGIFVSYFATVAAPAYPLRGYRCGAATGGTLANNATEVCRFDTAIPTSVAEIRYGNPTASSIDGAFFNTPAGIMKDTVGTIEQIDAPSGFNPFMLRPGEGVVLRQDAGAVGHLWNISILWREIGFV